MSDGVAAGYGKDLAYIHDVGFGAFARGAAPYVIERCAAAGFGGGRIVDLGCGGGILARALVDAGHEVLGIDISSEMIRLARKRVPEASFRIASFTEAEIPICQAVTALGEPLAYLFDDTNSRAALVRLFRKVFEALDSGGLFIFDLRESGTVPRGPFYEGASVGDDWAIFYRVAEDRRRRQLTRRLTTFRKAGKGYRRGDEVHRLRLYEGREIVEELRRVGFKARLVRSFGELQLAPKHAGFVARKPL